MGKSQTLTYIKFCTYVGLPGCGSYQYQTDSFPIVWVVLSLDGNIALESKAQQSNIFLSMLASYGFIESEEVCDLVAEGVTDGDSNLFHLFWFLYIVQLYEEDCAILQ